MDSWITTGLPRVFSININDLHLQKAIIVDARNVTLTPHMAIVDTNISYPLLQTFGPKVWHVQFYGVEYISIAAAVLLLCIRVHIFSILFDFPDENLSGVQVVVNS